MIRHLLNETVEVERQQTQDDGMGGESWVLASLGTFPAKVDQSSSITGETVASQHGAKRTHEVYFSPNADIRRDDRLIHEGCKLRVIGTTRPSHAVYLKAECEHSESGV